MNNVGNKRMGFSKINNVKRKRELPLHLMLIPGLIFILIFNYLPMIGTVIAFQNFNPAIGFLGKQEWVGFGNFQHIFNIPHIWRVVWNTFYIAIMKITTCLIIPIIFSLLLNEIKHTLFKKTLQTIIYFPYFLSWIILGGILIDILSPSTGIVNNFLKIFGFKPIYFLGNHKWFPYTIVIANAWKTFGFNTIVYLAAITSIDPTLYESSSSDGANRWSQTWHITLPGMRMIIVLMMVLSLGTVLDAGFDQIFNLYSPQVYETGDIIDTLVYRMSLIQSQFSPAAAVGLLKSIVACTLISTSYYIAYRLFDYRLF